MGSVGLAIIPNFGIELWTPRSSIGAMAIHSICKELDCNSNDLLLRPRACETLDSAVVPPPLRSQ